MNLDTRVAVNTFPSIFGRERIGDGYFYDWIPDGQAWQFQGYEEVGFARSVMQHCISICISTKIRSFGDRVLRTTKLQCEMKLTRVSSRSVLTTIPSHVFRSTVVVDDPHRMLDHFNTASHKREKTSI